MEFDKDKFIKALTEEMHNSIPYADSRSDISIQQTSDDSSEIQEVIAHVRHCGGDVKWIEDGAIMTYTNNKVSFFHILDYLDENDNVLDYDIQIMETSLNGVNRDITDEVDIDDIRDTNNVFFKVLIFMDPEVVMFDPVYVDVDEINSRNTYFDGVDDDDEDYEYDDYGYVYENLSHVSEFISWKGEMNESYYLFEKENGSAELHLVPPKPTGENDHFEINKFNVDANDNNGSIKMFQDMGYTITSKSKNKDIDYEMHGEPENVVVYDIEQSEKDGDKIVVKEMLNIMENATFHGDSKILSEIKRRIKVNFKGKKRIKMQCRKGFKFIADRRVCVKITGSEMMDMKRQHIRASRTKKAAGRGFEMRKQRKTKKALRFRKNLGLKKKPLV